MDGIIVVDKPEGWTSHDVVGKFRGIARTKRVGHLGTLDPMATGVLPLVVGQATRLARFYTRSSKVYEAVVRFGFATDTYDRTGTPVGEPCATSPKREEVEAVLPQFRGKIQQVPPQFSAKKVAGVPAYESARKQVAVELAPVEIEIYELTLLGMEGAELTLRVHCSGGTYIRTIADDLGKALGCGAHLAALRRTASAEFSVAQASTLPELQTLAKENRLGEVLAAASCHAAGVSVRHGG